MGVTNEVPQGACELGKTASKTNESECQGVGVYV